MGLDGRTYMRSISYESPKLMYTKKLKEKRNPEIWRESLPFTRMDNMLIVNSWGEEKRQKCATYDNKKDNLQWTNFAAWECKFVCFFYFSASLGPFFACFIPEYRYTSIKHISIWQKKSKELNQLK